MRPPSHLAAFAAAGDLARLVETGRWISEVLGRENASLVGRALTARKRREEEKEKEGARRGARRGCERGGRCVVYDRCIYTQHM